MILIDTVYQKVLTFANKEQRGYMTPQEFNNIGNQVQLEIFEKYFLPSINNQTNNNFKWLVYFDINTKTPFKKRIKNLELKYSFFIRFTLMMLIILIAHIKKNKKNKNYI